MSSFSNVSGQQSAALANFQIRQLEFAAYIRDPASNPLPQGIDERRMQVYVDNFFRSVRNFLRSTLKRTSKAVGPECWNAMVREFLARHACKSPFFLDMPTEFLEFLLNFRSEDSDSPFLCELCHFECTELELKYHAATLARDRPQFAEDAELVLSPLARPLSYAWNVLDEEALSSSAERSSERTWVILVRDRKHRVRRVHSTMLTHRLLQCFEHPVRLPSVASLLANELDAAVDAVSHQVRTTTEYLCETDVLVQGHEIQARPD